MRQPPGCGKKCHRLPQIDVSRTVFQVTRTQAPRSSSLWGAAGPGDEERQRLVPLVQREENRTEESAPLITDTPLNCEVRNWVIIPTPSNTGGHFCALHCSETNSCTRHTKSAGKHKVQSLKRRNVSKTPRFIVNTTKTIRVGGTPSTHPIPEDGWSCISLPACSS